MRARSLLLASLFTVLVSVARADETPAPPLAGIGWTIGNGLGVFGGDLLFFPSRRLALDLQLAFHREGSVYGTLTSYALAPVVRAYLRPEGSTPYIAVGVPVVRKTVASLTWYRAGFIANAGYEWRWRSGLAVLGGAGLGYAPTATAANAAQSLRDEGYLGLNLEAGVRYVFR